MSKHYQYLANMYLSAPIQNLYPGTTISINEGSAEITLPIHTKHHHAANAVHGSVYFRMLDDAAFFAANSLVADRFVLTVTFNTNLVRPVSEGILKCLGTVVNKSKKLITSESKLYNENGKLIAFGTGQFMISNIELDHSIGYK